MEAENQAISELAASALDAIPSAVLVAGRDGRIILRNAAGARMLPGGATVQEALLAGAEPALDWQADVALLAESGGRLDRRGITLAGRGDAQITSDIHLATLSGAGAGGAVLIVVTDVSARVSMERRLMASERLAAVGELAAKVAHELNNPLDGVTRYVGLAQRTAGQAAARHLDAARQGLLRMAGIIRDLLEQGSPRQGAGTPTAIDRGWGPPRWAAIDRLLEEAVAAMQPRAQALGVAVACDVADSPKAPVDGNIFQVFCNIIKNALDAMPGGGLLAIRQRAGDSRVTVEFADTGCGLPAGDAEKIFQPFFTTKPPGEGTGLGLAICREIIGRMGGAITAASRPQGGALVSVTIPVPSGGDQ
ncbi:MAG: nitrogen regulation protein NR(II) [Phycisphaerae bacterium]